MQPHLLQHVKLVSIEIMVEPSQRHVGGPTTPTTINFLGQLPNMWKLLAIKGQAPLLSSLKHLHQRLVERLLRRILMPLPTSNQEIWKAMARGIFSKKALQQLPLKKVRGVTVIS